MKRPETKEGHRRPGVLRAGAWMVAVLLVASGVACGPVDGAAPAEPLARRGQELGSTNSESLNGLAFNGLAFNGLAFNGLSAEGLAGGDFTNWFARDPALASMVMHYVVACAVPAGETRTYTDASGTSYAWQGSLGLAPDWAQGNPATLTEQQLISACLAAHVNKYGKTVAISVQGVTAKGQPIPTSLAELQEFSQREGAFFGNLFTNEGVFVCNDGRLLNKNETSVRACALSHDNTVGGGVCPPIEYVGSCAANCTPDPGNTFFLRCTHNGTPYVPITTRLHPQDIYQCGDGTCQLTETCGSNTDALKCTTDCGTCG